MVVYEPAAVAQCIDKLHAVMGILHVHSEIKHTSQTGHNYRRNLDKPHIRGTGHTEAVPINHAAQAQADI